MTELDKALVALWDDPENGQNQARFYDLFLNAELIVATTDGDPTVAGCGGASALAPLVLEFEGEDYLTLFDSEERLNSWAEKPLPFARISGHVLAELSEEGLFWALNVGTDFAKQFVPDEIAWLRQVVEQGKAEKAGTTSSPGSGE